MITDVKFLDKEQLRESIDGRTLIYDVFCQTDNNDNIIVEMQNQIQPNYKKRTIYYTSRAISRQGRTGRNWDYEIQAVYCISFLNFTMDSISTEFRTDVALMDMATGKLFSEDMRLIYLQLPRFTKTLEECESLFDKWIDVLKYMNVNEQLPKGLQLEIFKILDEVTDIDSLTKEEQLQYDYALKRYRDTLGMYRGAKEEGIRIGEEKGREEERIEMARSLKALGVAWETIQAVSSLTIEEIAHL